MSNFVQLYIIKMEEFMVEPNYTNKANAKINNLRWALDLTKCFRKQYQMSFIEFIINALMNSQIFRNKLVTDLRSRIYQFIMGALVTFCSILAISYIKTYVQIGNVKYLTIAVIFVYILLFLSYIWPMGLLENQFENFARFSSDQTFETNQRFMKQNLCLATLKFIFYVSFLSPNVLRPNKDLRSYTIKEHPIVEDFLLQLRIYMQTQTYHHYWLENDSEVFKRCFQSIKFDLLKYRFTQSDESEYDDKIKIGEFIRNDFFGFLKACIYAELIYLEHGRRFCKDNRMPESHLKVYVNINESGEDSDPVIIIFDYTMEETTQDKISKVYYSLGIFSQIVSYEFYAKNECLKPIIIKWLKRYWPDNWETEGFIRKLYRDEAYDNDVFNALDKRHKKIWRAWLKRQRVKESPKEKTKRAGTCAYTSDELLQSAITREE